MRQRPLAQRNSLGPHVGYSAVGERQPVKKGSGGKRRGSRASLTALLRLVGAVAAVAVVVTHEVLGNALSVLAHELVAVARVDKH